MDTARAQRGTVRAGVRGSRFRALGLSACMLAIPILTSLAPRATAAGADAARFFDQQRQKAQAQEPKRDEPIKDQTAADDSQKILDRMRGEEGFKNGSLARQVEVDLFLANQALKAGDYDRARLHGQRVVAGAKIISGDAQASRLRAEGEAVVASAQQGGKKALDAQRKTEMDAAGQKAAGERAASHRALRDRGWDAYEAGDYQKAMKMADQIIAADPTSKEGQFLRAEAAKATGKTDDKAIKAEARRSRDKLLFEKINDELVPPGDIQAKVVIAGKKDLGEAGAPALSRSLEPWERDLRAKLAERITVGFTDTTLSEACRQLSEITGSAIMVDPAASKNAQRINLPKMTVSFDHILKWLGVFCNVTYTLRDHAILVTTPGGLLDQPVSRQYDVAGLILPTRIVRATFNGINQTDDAASRAQLLSGVTEAKPEAETKDTVGEGWVQFIRSTVAPESWDRPAVLQEKPRYSIAYRNGRIVVLHTPEVQEEIERLLDNFRKARNLQVHILARFIELSVDFLDQLNINWLNPLDERNNTPPGPARYGFESLTKHYTYGKTTYDALGNPITPVTRYWTLVADEQNLHQVGAITDSVTNTGGLHIDYAYMGEDEVHAMLDAVLKRRKGTILLAPRLTCFNTQRANFQAVTNYNYVRTISADNEPEIGNIPDGIIFDVQPFVSADRRSITLVLQPQLRQFVSLDPFAYVRPLGSATALPGQIIIGTQRVVQVPVTKLKSMATTVTVPDGGTLLLGGLTSVNESKGYASVPFVVGIPILQYLFRSWAEAERRDSFIVLVTAQIVPDIFEEE